MARGGGWEGARAQKAETLSGEPDATTIPKRAGVPCPPVRTPSVATVLSLRHVRVGRLLPEMGRIEVK